MHDTLSEECKVAKRALSILRKRGFYFTLAKSSVIGSPPETTGLIGSEADSIVRSLSKRCLHREEFCLFERFGDT